MYDDDLEDLPPMSPKHVASLHSEIDRIVVSTLDNLWEIAGILECPIDPRPHAGSIQLIVDALTEVVRVAGVVGPLDLDSEWVDYWERKK